MTSFRRTQSQNRFFDGRVCFVILATEEMLVLEDGLPVKGDNTFDRHDVLSVSTWMIPTTETTFSLNSYLGWPDPTLKSHCSAFCRSFHACSPSTHIRDMDKGQKRNRPDSSGDKNPRPQKRQFEKRRDARKIAVQSASPGSFFIWDYF